MAADECDAQPPASNRVVKARKVPVGNAPRGETHRSIATQRRSAGAGCTEVRTCRYACLAKRMRNQCSIHAHGVAAISSSSNDPVCVGLAPECGSPAFNMRQRNRGHFRIKQTIPVVPQARTSRQIRKRIDALHGRILSGPRSGIGSAGRNFPCFDKSDVFVLPDVLP